MGFIHFCKHLTYASELQEVAGRHGVSQLCRRHPALSEYRTPTQQNRQRQWSTACLILNDGAVRTAWRLAERGQVRGHLARNAGRQQLTRLSPSDMILRLNDSVLYSSNQQLSAIVVCIIDELLSMDDNARHCVKTCFHHLRRIRQLRRYRLWHFADTDTSANNIVALGLGLR